MNVIKTTEELDAAIRTSHDHSIVIFKHSATCPFSARAQEQVANAKHDIDIYALVVQYVPEISKAVAKKLDVEHQSPQAIVVKDGKATNHFWRSDIQTDKLVELAGTPTTED